MANNLPFLYCTGFPENSSVNVISTLQQDNIEVKRNSKCESSGKQRQINKNRSCLLHGGLKSLQILFSAHTKATALTLPSQRPAEWEDEFVIGQIELSFVNNPPCDLSDLTSLSYNAPWLARFSPRSPPQWTGCFTSTVRKERAEEALSWFKHLKLGCSVS